MGAITLLLLQLFMSRTMLGKAIRATATDSDAAALVGVNTARVQMIAFGLGIALAGLAGALMSLVYNSIPIGSLALAQKFQHRRVGRLRKFYRVALGAIVLALVETFSVPLGVNCSQDLMSFALLVIVLVVMPGGIMGFCNAAHEKDSISPTVDHHRHPRATASVPFTASAYQTLIFFTFIYISLSAAWNIIGGYGGQISFGHSAFYGLGAYTRRFSHSANGATAIHPLLTIPIAGSIALSSPSSSATHPAPAWSLFLNCHHWRGRSHALDHAER